MKKFINTIDRLSGFSGGISGLLVAIALIIVVAEIVTRSVLGKTIYISDEYSGYLMSMLTFMGLAYTLRERGHIRVLVMTHLLRGKRRVIFNMSCSLIGFLFCMALTNYTSVFFWDSVVNKTQSMQITETYLAIPQIFLPLGSFLFMLQFLSDFFKGIAILKNDTEGLVILEETDELGR
ncbi:MAG: TRAP transporter small permease subunit [Syntrophales bacterium]